MQANKDAQDLYDVSGVYIIFQFFKTIIESLFLIIIYNLKAGEGKFGTDDSEFVRILCSRSFPHLNAIFSAYSRISSKDIEKAIKKEMSGDLEKGFLEFFVL